MNKRFDEKRNVFKPYGFSCEMWVPSLMHRPDRHNEIEINFFPFSVFLEWKLSTNFVEKVLNGEIISETNPSYSSIDESNLKRWFDDFQKKKNPKIALLEIQGRVNRMACEFMADASGNFAYIAQKYSDPIKVSDIAQAIDLHPDHANSIFKKTFGTTLSEYLTEERISHAQRELLTTDLPITKLAFNCGFQSISRFNAAFLKITGCTPREFRKKNR